MENAMPGRSFFEVAVREGAVGGAVMHRAKTVIRKNGQMTCRLGTVGNNEISCLLSFRQHCVHT